MEMQERINMFYFATEGKKRQKNYIAMQIYSDECLINRVRPYREALTLKEIWAEVNLYFFTRQNPKHKCALPGGKIMKRDGTPDIFGTVANCLNPTLTNRILTW